jgi:hypothetical protein
MSKRRRDKSLTKHPLLVLSGLLMLLAAGLGAMHVWMLFHNDAILLTPPVPNFRSAREIYPYSVIPGGVVDAQEVTDTIAHDPVARAHYAGIHAERLWATRANESMLAYVSYRKDDSVYWTTHPVRIAEGEIILTDGTNRIRGRCGNRIEVKRPTPLPGLVSTPDVPPPDIVFETPMPPLIPFVIVPPLPPTEIVTNRPSPQPPHAGPVPPWPPPVPPPWSPPVPTSLPVPEPGTLLLVGTGLALLAKLAMRKRG